MPVPTRIGDFTLTWGESLRWDERRQRLYFVDCAARTLHWLEGAEPPLHTMDLPGTPTGLVLTNGDEVIVALDDGLHLVEPDRATHHRFAAYPEGLGGRANDAAADLSGNLVLGTLNLEPGPGSYWWFSSTEGWRQLDSGIGNANGPVVIERGGEQTLVFADTLAGAIYAYPYDGDRGRVGARRLIVDLSLHGGVPDGACADGTGGVWTTILGRGAVARFEDGELTDLVDAGVELPSDVTFGGAGLDRLHVVSIAVPMGGVEVRSPLAGALVALDDLGVTGREEPRFTLA